MAYNPTPPPSPASSNRGGNKLTRGKPSMAKPFVEEVEPTPSPVLGDIKFQKTIYSQDAFRKKVDVSISELKPKKEKIDIQGFFKQYSKIFFDIPKEGITSHDTLIRESMDYFNDFKDPKDEQIKDLEGQVEALNNRINRHIIGANKEDIIESAFEASSIGEDLEEQAENTSLLLEIGNPSDPNIYWSNDSTRLLFPDGLKKTAQYAEDNEQLPNGNNPFEEGNQRGLNRDINDAYDRGGDSNIRQYQEIRTYSEWKADTDRRSSGGETRDIVLLLDYIKDFTKQTYEDMTS